MLCFFGFLGDVGFWMWDVIIIIIFIINIEEGKGGFVRDL